MVRKIQGLLDNRVKSRIEVYAISRFPESSEVSICFYYLEKSTVIIDVFKFIDITHSIGIIDNKL